jgi:sugar/nucleoside kinase (ribokinase family)/class 3 adenylate cyclase
MALKQTKTKFTAGRKLVGIMFLDVKHFSTLSQTQLERFIDDVLPALAATIDPYRDHLLELNTWGDAIIAVSEDPVLIARLSLDLRDYFRKTNFEALGLPQTLRSRISLHAGPVKYGQDPIRNRLGIIGANVNLAARIEPIIVPGEVWATADFAQMLAPHVSAERLAFDDIGYRDLAKGYGRHPLRKLRRADEPASLSEIAEEAIKTVRSLSSINKAIDLVAIGALNTDYIATATSLKKIRPDLIAEHERHFELGKERAASQSEVRDVISQIGRGLLTVSLGGSSFNTIHALARALPDRKLAYIGVAGTSESDVGFVDLLSSLNVDASCIKSSPNEGGICVSYITRGERSLLTSPGANVDMAAYLTERKEEIIELVGRARLVHVTSLFDRESPPVLAHILREAKDKNPWLQLSFDPGHDWVRRVKTGERSAPIEEILSLSSYLFVNQNEFEMLASDLGIKDDQELAKDIFQYLSSQAVLIVLKKYDEIRVYHKLHKRMKEVRFLIEPLAPNRIEDATGAGDVFAAGLFVAILTPGLELRDGIELGLRMVRKKLATPGATDFSSFTRIVEEYVDSIYEHRQ